MDKNCLFDCGYELKEQFEKVEDMFDIFNRIKEIDENYILLFNKKDKQFEVHNTKQNGCSFVCAVDVLDCRVIQYLQKTRIENIASVIQDIDYANEQMDSQKNERTKIYSSNFASEALTFAERSRRNLVKQDFDEIKKCLGE